MAGGISIHRRIFWLVFLILVFGHVMLFSASAVIGLQKHGSEFYFVTRQALTGLFGLLLAFLLSRTPYRLWQKLAFPLILFQLFLVALTFFPHFSHHALGATRWLDLGFFTFQPSEFAKFTVCIYFAKLISEWKQISNRPAKMAFLFVPLLLTLLLIYKTTDLGTIVLLAAVGLCLLFLAGVPWKYVGGFLFSATCLATLAMWYSPYRRRRLLAFFNPWDDPQGRGFQTIQSFLSIFSGKIFGVGVGNGNSKLFYLPEVHTDFIYSLVSEELGFVGAILLLFAFVYLCHLFLQAAAQAKDDFGTYLGFGLGLIFAFQVLVNLGGVVGLLPVKGLPLPFLSWGRSALLINLAMVGVLLNICRGGTVRSSSVPS